MTPDGLKLLYLICFIVFCIGSIVKLIFWYKTKKAAGEPGSLLSNYFKWFSVYAMYNNDNFELKTFMRINNLTNSFIWLATLTVIFFKILGPARY